MLNNISLEKVSIMMQMISIILLMLFVGKEHRQLLRVHLPLLGPWVSGCIAMVFDGQQKLFCSVKEAEPITPQRSQHQEINQNQKNKVYSNANYLSWRINPFHHPNHSTFLRKDLSGCLYLFTFILLLCFRLSTPISVRIADN